ncbi:hypothetical protein GCM10010448_39650 [Streptomyces glomeratus]|uniref:Tn3 transposase DDE domain-containing protein n=1 Tax=Streptomyces glomeratus TaxID=284452 RepID=A0ABP6LPQ6_9ACTN
MRHAQPVGEGGDTGYDGRQQTRRRGARNLEAIRHRQISYVSSHIVLMVVRNHPEISRSLELTSRSRHNCGEIRPSTDAKCHDS